MAPPVLEESNLNTSRQLRPRRSALKDISNVVPAAAADQANSKAKHTGKRSRRSSNDTQGLVIETTVAQGSTDVTDLTNEASDQQPLKTRRVSASKSKDQTQELTPVQVEDIVVPPAAKVRRLSTTRPKIYKNADPAQCYDYVDDLYNHYYEVEDIYRASQYMTTQKDINQRMRAILVDWLVEVHHKFKLQTQTLWLCVNLLDRYLETTQVHRSKLQLVGVSSLLIACKFEEIYPPEVRDCVYITDYAYEREEVLQMETKILEKLSFQISVPTGYHFMNRYLNLINAQERTRLLTHYYTERNLQEYDSLLYSPCKLAAASVYAALLQQYSNAKPESKTRSAWPHILFEETGLTEADLIPITKVIIQHVGEEPITASRRHLVAAKKKYDAEKYQNVSRLPLPNV